MSERWTEAEMRAFQDRVNQAQAGAVVLMAGGWPVRHLVHGDGRITTLPPTGYHTRRPEDGFSIDIQAKPRPKRVPDIGLIGRARSGKDTAAEFLVHWRGYKRMALADGVRDMAAAINPIVQATDFTGPVLRYRDVIEMYGYEGAKDHFPEVRRLLQAIGTEAVRDQHGEDFWIDAFFERYNDRGNANPVVVTDVRFLNEAEELRDNGFVLVRLTRGPREDDELGLLHRSETELDDYPVDYEVANDGEIVDLHRELTKVVENF